MTDHQSKTQRLKELLGQDPAALQITGRGVRVITSCTGLKAITSHTAMRYEDFLKGPAWVSEREQEGETCPAERMYTGRQHIELLRGVRNARDRKIPVSVDIVSAGYGLVNGDRRIAPYDVTFSGLSANQIRTLADASGLPAKMRGALGQEYDLTLVLLGKEYLKACALPGTLDTPSPVVFIASDSMRSLIPEGDKIRVVSLTVDDTRTFNSGFVDLKGTVAAAILEQL